MEFFCVKGPSNKGKTSVNITTYSVVNQSKLSIIKLAYNIKNTLQVRKIEI
jgi:hypothetical protein